MPQSLIHRLRRQARTNPIPPLAILIVANPPPATALALVLDELHGREIVFVLLHRRDPRHVVEGDGLQPEVRVVGDLVDGGEEGGQVGRRVPVDGRDEVCGCEAVLVGGGAARLPGGVSGWLVGSVRWGWGKGMGKTYSRGDVDFAVEFADLLPDGVVGPV